MNAVTFIFYSGKEIRFNVFDISKLDIFYKNENPDSVLTVEGLSGDKYYIKRKDVEIMKIERDENDS